MHIHILGICGTFMAGIALLARELGHFVTGSDQGVYPPMSDLLAQSGIPLTSGYDPAQLDPQPDLVIIGNALSRGNPCVEYVLDNGLHYTSGPQWLFEQVLSDRWVIAVSGTHGKTTTSSMLVWILKQLKFSTGYLIGGIPMHDMPCATLGESSFFVIEADEYDSAFFDKRSKFLHYHPRTLIINNLEFDHADIFQDLAAIQTQFHYLVRTVPSLGRIIYAGDEQAVLDTLAKGCWSEKAPVFSGKNAWRAVESGADCAEFDVFFQGLLQGRVHWNCFGKHNMRNAIMAIAAANHIGVPIPDAIKALSGFQLPKRRLERIGEVADVVIYDDFAHHPTAIQATLSALRHKFGGQRILAVFEPRSNSMKMGVFVETLGNCFADADELYFFAPPQLNWNVQQLRETVPVPFKIFQDIETLVNRLVAESRAGDYIVIMSNGSFGNIQKQLLTRLSDYHGLLT